MYALGVLLYHMLLGELPFFAVGIPNPKASLAVLRAFAKIAGVSVDLAEMEEQANMVELHHTLRFSCREAPASKLDGQVIKLMPAKDSRASRSASPKNQAHAVGL